ncbi:MULTISPECIES: YybH family protein [unclassified Pseudoclavibacter]|uniref:YybH family protein n=1 Tax=unclassified Pseudoclavibacter TaxID=2615177 RepID=UPI001BA64648|nr:nuclear transport factor 2 family protein [Pseudoclavibacter sp. Marseille-Q4354]MBS3178348.1 nuclear transport factor 2 family protein [Pseudoclavibacter sp. Marseille-Q4354]
MSITPTHDAVLDAADAIIDAFRATDTEAYFAGFVPDASFIFHPEPARLDSRAEYEALWAGWIAGGWRVTSCASTDRLVQVFPGGAVFSHTVATSIDSADGPDSYLERESIIFTVGDDGSLLAIHEHLSAPTTDTEATS